MKQTNKKNNTGIKRMTYNSRGSLTVEMETGSKWGVIGKLARKIFFKKCRQINGF